MTRRVLIALFGAVLAALSVSAADSRLPKETINWLQNTGANGNGDRDDINVIFFEIPDSVSSTLYFAANDPGTGGGSPDAGNTMNTDFYLVGGTGAVTSPDSRLADYSSDPNLARTGTVLDSYQATTESGWVYFSGVSPSQGEHIGSKYYFKIVVDAQDNDADKNAYQVDISYSNSGAPDGINGVRTFAYSWTVALLNNVGNTWDIYPFVPEDDTGNIQFHNWDFDDDETGEAFNKSGVSQGAVTSSSNNVSATTSFALSAAEDNGTWRYQITEANGGVVENTSEIWFTNSVSGELYRAYSSFLDYDSIPPDHVELAEADGIAIANGTDIETVTLQIVASGGSPVPYSRNTYVSVDSGAVITESNTGAVNAASTVVTTDGDGLGFIKVKKYPLKESG